MCHVLFQEWTPKCKFILHCALHWSASKQWPLMGALYLEPTAECNLGVGHFHEVAWWSPYHTSQKASHMKYETQQFGKYTHFSTATFWWTLNNRLGNSLLWTQRYKSCPTIIQAQYWPYRTIPSIHWWCVGWIGHMLENEAKPVWKCIGGHWRGEEIPCYRRTNPTFQHLRISASVSESYHAMIWKHSDL